MTCLRPHSHLWISFLKQSLCSHGRAGWALGWGYGYEQDMLWTISEPLPCYSLSVSACDTPTSTSGLSVEVTSSGKPFLTPQIKVKHPSRHPILSRGAGQSEPCDFSVVGSGGDM